MGEGHRELRSPDRPVQRNAVPRGFELFDIDENHIEFLSFSDAVVGALIRGVKVEEDGLSNDPALFAKQIIEAHDKIYS